MIEIVGEGRRICPPEATWARVAGVLPQVGITRVADLTWLDDIGIPVFQAVRPNARTLSVSQGKGLTAESARISAVMESLELWHAENVPDSGWSAPVAKVRGNLGYSPWTLRLAEPHCLTDQTRLDWTEASRLGSGEATLVPTVYLRLDSRVSGQWCPPLFEVTSNGLASGNSKTEALVHALYEVLERDTLWRSSDQSSVVDIDAVPAPAADLLARFRAAGVTVCAEVLPAPGLVCIRVAVSSPDVAATFAGVGIHLDRQVALCRALTEAAQSRTTAIAGTREDVTDLVYRPWHPTGDSSAPAPAAAVPFSQLCTSPVPERTEEELRLLIDLAQARFGQLPIAVDHTRPRFGIPVVRVVCPGAGYPTSF